MGLVAAGLAGVLVLVGAVLVRLDPPATSNKTDEAPGAEDRAASDTAHDSSGGSSSTPQAAHLGRDQAGAVGAALNYSAASQRWLYLTDDEITAAITAIATPEAASTLADEVLGDVRTAREELTQAEGRVWWLVRPLAWKVENHGTDEASVAVWTVTVLSATGVAIPQSEWMTVTVDLEWIDGAWCVAAVRDHPGPTPMTGPHDDPWDAQPFDDALDGFTRIDQEADQ